MPWGKTAIRAEIQANEQPANGLFARADRVMCSPGTIPGEKPGFPDRHSLEKVGYFEVFLSGAFPTEKMRHMFNAFSFKWIQQNHEKFLEGKARMGFRLDDADRSFGSLRQKEFYALA